MCLSSIFVFEKVHWFTTFFANLDRICCSIFYWGSNRNRNEDNWVFPYWLSLNSLNSMNRDKVQKCMVTRNTSSLLLVAFSDEVAKIEFLLLLYRYLFSVVSGDRYLPRGSKENVLSVTISRNVTVSRKAVPALTIPLLDFAMIHWIQWNSLRENSNELFKWKFWHLWSQQAFDLILSEVKLLLLYIPKTTANTKNLMLHLRNKITTDSLPYCISH